MEELSRAFGGSAHIYRSCKLGSAPNELTIGPAIPSPPFAHFVSNVVPNPQNQAPNPAQNQRPSQNAPQNVGPPQPARPPQQTQPPFQARPSSQQDASFQQAFQLARNEFGPILEGVKKEANKIREELKKQTGEEPDIQAVIQIAVAEMLSDYKEKIKYPQDEIVNEGYDPEQEVFSAFESCVA